jgi:nucleoside-diphosphate-sugar epimerase
VGRPIVRAREDQRGPAAPIGLYPRTKALAEQRVLAANAAGFCTVVVRPRFVWGKGDTTLLPQLVEAVKAGSFRWIAGGQYLTSTCHVRNLCEGMIRAAESGRGGEIYFLTDGEPVQVRTFVSALLQSQGVHAPERSIPHWLARLTAWAVEGVWRLFRLRRNPPVTRVAVKLIGEEVTVDDSKARQQIGYRNRISREDGLAEMGAA